MRGGFDVRFVLVGQRFGRQTAALAIDALVVRQLTIGFDPGMNLLTADFGNGQYHAPIIKQQSVASADIIDQFFVINTDSLLIAVFDTQAGIEYECIAFFQRNFFVLEARNADFWAL